MSAPKMREPRYDKQGKWERVSKPGGVKRHPIREHRRRRRGKGGAA